MLFSACPQLPFHLESLALAFPVSLLVGDSDAFPIESFSIVQLMSSSDTPENVQVVVRCRPFNSKELAAGHVKICAIDTKSGQICLTNPAKNEESKAFSFDAVFDEDATQIEVYNVTARKIVDAVLEGVKESS